MLGELHVGVNTDRFVETFKRKPVVPDWQRQAIVRGSKHVHATYENDGPGKELICRLSPDLLAIGSDWHENEYLKQIGMDDEWAFDLLGIGIVYLPRTPRVSSTELRA